MRVEYMVLKFRQISEMVITPHDALIYTSVAKMQQPTAKPVSIDLLHQKIILSAQPGMIP